MWVRYLPDVFIGIDPRMRSLVTAVFVDHLSTRRRHRSIRRRQQQTRPRQKEQKERERIVAISTREYRHLARVNDFRLCYENLKKREPWYAALVRAMPSFKTTNFDLYWDRLHFFWLHVRFLLAFSAEQAFLRWRFTQDRAKMASLTTLATRIVPKPSKRVCIAYGDWSRRDGIKGHPTGPVKGFIGALKKRATVIPMDEYRTSITCSCCHKRLKQTRLLNNVKRKDDEADVRTKENPSPKELKEIAEMSKFRNPKLASQKIVLRCSRNVLRCTNSCCKANFWNRNVNAVRNMLELLLSGRSETTESVPARKITARRLSSKCVDASFIKLQRKAQQELQVMAARGAFLAPVLVPVNSCFVNLPPAFVQTFLGGPELVGAGSTILELSWETVDGYVQRICVGWIGGIVKDGALRSDIIEVPAEFARCVGIQDHLEKMPQAFIGVHVVEVLPIARQVNVEPCTPDDWELIQLHAGAIETELLRQMCVVNDKQVSPIWINQHTLIHIRASLPVGMEHARLTPVSEVIVAPKERQVLPTGHGLSPDLYFEQSPALLVQVGRVGTLTGNTMEGVAHENETADEVWVHPETLVMLDGAVISKAPSDAQEAPVVALWSSESKSSDTIPATNEHGESPRMQPECYVARLKASHDVVPGHIVLNRGASASLGIKAHESVFLRVLKLPELPPSSVTVFVNFENPSGDYSILAGHVQQAFLRWSSSTEHSRIVSSGSILRIALENGEAVEVLTDVQYDTEEAFSADQLEGVPVGALEKYTVLGGSSGHILLLPQVTVQTASGHYQQVLTKMRNSTSISSLNQSVLELSRSEKPYSTLMKAVRPVLSRDASAARVLLGTKPPGCALLNGERGNGKSTLLRALVHEVQTSSQFSAVTTIVECRNLRGLKMDTVKTRLNELFEEASAHAPALIVLDNLDALIPEEDESAGAANEQSRRIAELLLVLMNQNCQRMWKTTAELNASFKREWDVIKGLSDKHKQQARKKLLETVGHAMQSKSVAVVAASRSDTSIHKTLRGCGLFDRPIQVASPDAERRETLIHEMLQMKVNIANSKGKSSRQMVIDPAIDYGSLSSVTEGYSLRDLSSATDRAFHQVFKRYALRDNKHSEVTHKIQQSDFVEGIEDFQPTALIGVDLFKSSIKWSDVGGLQQVRTVLKDTLELPTRYAKLYDNTPIKLPAGMLLYGPPGCGKTLLASAVAHECGLNFISVKGPEVLNKYIGASEQAIRDLFARAGSAAPSVLFLDEFDSIAPRRGADNTGVTDRLVNQLLTFLDGVEARKGVYVLAATSRPDMIDPALLRPGRLDKSLYCGFPNEEERLDILRAVSKDMELSDEALEYLPEIARAPKSSHFSGADLQAIMYSAQLELVHEKLNGDGSNLITKTHVQTSFENAKPSTSDSARLQFERMYAGFSKARNTDFSVAEADASATSESLKSHIAHQRTALANMVNIVGLSSLNNRNDDDRQDGDQPNQYYAGGASDRGGGSGLSVIGPGGDDHVANIIGRAQQDAGAGAADTTQPRHVITFYREGFTVNDGSYRLRSDPTNRPFLEALERGHVPQELEGENRNEPVEISLVDKRQEDYVAPPPPAYTAFSGEGQTMGSATYAAEAVIHGDAEAAERPVIDDKKPTTTLQIRLHNGQRLRETLNLDHTIRDLHAIIQLNDAGAQPYTLLAGFPPRPVSTDLAQTIEQAGLKGAAVTQKLI
ncbi:Peroxisome biosynthesis protein PAS1 [Phytophthora citrophthora]|uniref:Peroxisomal ATPase PEX1 n=1 Tax=Phytophthora citrophthora TaxID=4793 RepID=A0AAD9GM52_9STRA|nr:Peroxisome biosynthesis protein PAS1 [Phytophthora citrophthora]